MAPLVRRTWAPQGVTPLFFQRTRSHQKVSAIAALVVSPERDGLSLYFRLHPNHNLTMGHAVCFLRQLLTHIPGPLVVVWDNLRTHHGKKIDALLCDCLRLDLKYFPPYAPELNPVEYAWGYLKANPLANLSVREVEELADTSRRSCRSLQRSQGLLRSFMDKAADEGLILGLI